MAHELEIMENGDAAGFFVKKKPWHELGQILDNPPTVIEGIKAAGLDWEVKLEPISIPSGEVIPDKFATVRSSDNSVLGIVGNAYKPLQNIESFNFFDPFLESGVASLESAGSLFNGRKIWVLAKIDSKNLKVGKDDEIEKYILLQNSHDGSMAVRVGYTPIRVVCNNTLQMAIDNGNSQLVRVFHMGKVKETIEAVREVMDAADASFKATEAEFKRLTKMDINEMDLRKYINTVFKKHQSEEDQLDTLEAKEKEGKIITKVTELFETGMGSELKTANGTMWGAYNAVVEYLQYERGDSNEQRLNNLWFKRGTGNKAQKALKLALSA